MPQEIKTIGLGGVNCYLVNTGAAFILIDTGLWSSRGTLERQLVSAGCNPGNLRLIVITHGDQDHAGNCAYLREKYGTKIVMHEGDSGMVERGDMNWNRKAKPDRFSLVFRVVSRVLSSFVRSNRFGTFTPDEYVEDGYDLNTYGFDAHVLHLPGHSRGSLGILTASGDLFCGDLLMNMRKPDLHFMIDDLAESTASIERLRKLNVRTVYPGHGKPFPMERLMRVTRPDAAPTQ
jgi:hydroxyacylglutathione hydrolase